MELGIIISHVLSWALVIGMGFVLLGNLRATGLLSWRLAQLEATTPSRIGRSGLKPGKPAPRFTLPSVTGEEVSLADFSGRKVLLVFVQAGCGPCHDVAPELNRFSKRNSSIQVLVINNATAEEACEYAREVGAQFPVLVQDKWSVSKKYEVFATPFGFLIDEDGVIAANGIVSSREHFGYLLSSAASRAPADGRGVEPAIRGELNGTESTEVRDSVSFITREVRHA